MKGIVYYHSTEQKNGYFNNIIFKAILLTIVHFGCTNQDICQEEIYFQEENGHTYDDNFTLEKSGEKVFELDSITGFYHQSMNHFQYENVDYFSLVNQQQRMIYIYDYKTGKIRSRIYLEEKGPNGVGSMGMMGHYIHTLDSIYVLSYQEAKLRLIDSLGVIHQTVTLLDLDNQDYYDPYPKILTEKPAFVKGRKLVFTGRAAANSIIDHTKTKNAIEVDMDNGSIRRFLGRDALYNCGNWGLDMKYRLYNSYNSNTGNFIFSFGADPFIYEHDGNELKGKHYLGSKFVDQVEPISRNRDIMIGKEVSKEKAKKFGFTSAEYGFIIYDEHKNMYYRFMNLGLDEEAFNSINRKKYFKPVSVIIADENFRKVGEIKMPYGEHFYFGFFINKNGLHIANYNKYLQDENKLTFDIFKLRKK